jgi:HlyD family type I secretion membrane fusion protein
MTALPLNLLSGPHTPFDGGPDDAPPPAQSAQSSTQSAQRDLRRAVRIGALIIAGLAALVFVMAALIHVNGAVIAQGQVITQARVQQVAHPTGGVIAELYVAEGARVRRGQPLLRLDSRVSDVNAAMAGQSLQQLLAASARLRAERDGRGGIAFPTALTAHANPAAHAAMQEASAMFRLRRHARASRQAQVRERLYQTDREIDALLAQASAARQQAALIAPEVDGLRRLHERGLVTVGRLNQMERSAIELDAASAAYAAQVAQARARMAEIRQSALQIDQEARSAAGAELSEVIAALGDQTVRSAAATDTQDRSIIRAPFGGVVERLNFATIGGVVPPAQAILDIVPDRAGLNIEIRVDPRDIDQVQQGGLVVVHFAALGDRTIPDVAGRVTRTSADRLTDERSGAAYYRAVISISDSERARLGNRPLVAGMPVEAFVQTGERSLLAYVFAPLFAQFNRAFRES